MPRAVRKALAGYGRRQDHYRTGRHELRRIAEGQFRAFLIGAEGHVGDDERALATACDAAGVIDHVGLRYWQRGVVALQHHAERIADQQRIDAAGFGHAGEGGVIAGQHDNLLAAFALAGKIHGRQTSLGGLGRHANSNSIMAERLSRIHS